MRWHKQLGENTGGKWEGEMKQVIGERRKEVRYAERETHTRRRKEGKEKRGMVEDAGYKKGEREKGREII